MIHAPPLIAFVLYILAAVLFLTGTVPVRERVAGIARRVFVVAFFVHTISLGVFLFDNRLQELANGGDYFYWLSWTIGLFYLLLRKRLDFPVVGAIVSPVIAFFMASSSYLVHFGESRPEHSSFFIIGSHVIPALISEGCLLLACLVSALFLWQNRRLKEGDVAVLAVKGPSLEALDMVHFRLILVGFIAMTLAVLSGVLWAVAENFTLLSSDMRQWLALAVWGVLGVILHSRSGLRWSPRRVSQLTIWVAAIFVTSILFLVFSGEGLHGSRFIN